MFRIIDRKPYDTEEAEPLAQFMPNAAPGAVPGLREPLYKRGDNDYFLHLEEWNTAEYYVINYDEMDPSTDTVGHNFVKKFDDMGCRISSSEYVRQYESIVPVTDEEAVDWCENRAIDGDIVVEEFGHLIET